MSGIEWGRVLEHAALIVRSYDTAVTLRQLHYQLVVRPELGYPNTQSAYKGLSSRTAKLRRDGLFPDLMDRTRAIHRAAWWESPTDALGALTDQYRLDRTEGQAVSIVIAVEKDGLVIQLEEWFGGLGVPIVAVSGYSSQSYVRDVVRDVHRYDRPAVLLYAGDHDPSGEDIDRDFVARTGCWHHVERIALSSAQVDKYNLPLAIGKAKDPRVAGFVARHGELRQVELDALNPNVLRGLYADVLGEWWNPDAHQLVLARENEDVSTLTATLAAMGGAR